MGFTRTYPANRPLDPPIRSFPAWRLDSAVSLRGGSSLKSASRPIRSTGASATGRLHELHRGVYLVGHSVPPPLAAEQAALLAHRNQAVLSHRSAASLWNLLPYPATAPVWITIPPERNPKRPGIETRRARLARRDIRWHQGLPLTSPPRTILDVASLLAKDDLESLVADAHFRHLASEPELHDQLARNRGRRGTGPDARLVVEVDGYDAHSGRASFERDRLKHATLNAGGLTVMPVTGRQVDQDPVGVVERLLRGLEDRLET